MPNPLNLLDQRFGRLVVSAADGSERGRRMWLCICDCGNETRAASKTLRNGHKRSCGCLVRDVATQNIRGARNPGKHGMTGTSTYNIWKSMISRATGKGSSIVRERYKAISVCERWLSFDNFLADMGERPAGLTLERMKNELGYEPGNCKWATYTEQANNRRPRRRNHDVQAARREFLNMRRK